MIALCVAGCAGAAPGAPPQRTAQSDDRARAACAARTLPARRSSDGVSPDVDDTGPIRAVEIRGIARVPRAIAKGVVRAGPAPTLDRELVASDVRALFALEAFSDVTARLEPDGDGERLIYEVVERPLLGRVIGPAALGLRSGDVYDAAQIHRRATDLVARAVAAGYPQARVRVGGARAPDGSVDVCVDLHQGPHLLVDRVEFAGNRVIDTSALRAALFTGDGAVDAPGKPYRAEAAPIDLARLRVACWERGLLDAEVRPLPPLVHAARGTITPRFAVNEGPVFHVGKVVFRGPLIAPAATYAKLLGATPGQVFATSRFYAGMARIRHYYLWRGKPEPNLEPDAKLDRARGVVDVVVTVKP